MTLTFPNVFGNLEVYMDVMKAICGETEGRSMIDLMCAFAPNTPMLGFSKRMYIDVLPRELDHKEEQKNFVQDNVLNFPPRLMKHIFNNFFDVSICSDGIEHLTREDGFKVLDIMARVSMKQIIFTPLDDLFGMAKEGDNNPEAHRSLWHPDMLPEFNSIVFPDYHKEWNGGAWFGFSSPSMKYDFERIKLILKTKQWAHGIHE